MTASSSLSSQTIFLGSAAALVVVSIILIAAAAPVWLVVALLGAALVSIGLTVIANFRLQRRLTQALDVMVALQKGDFERRLNDVEEKGLLGEVLWAAGQQDEARRVFADAARRDPRNEALQSAMQRLQVRP